MAILQDGAIALAWLLAGCCLAFFLWGLGQLAAFLLTYAFFTGPLGVMVLGVALYLGLRQAVMGLKSLFLWLNRSEE